MPKIPDRKMWDARTKSYMSFPGIPPLNIEVGRTYGATVRAELKTLGYGGES